MTQVLTMLKTQNNIASFVLRFTQELWQDEQGEPQVQWRGHIRHVQGDEEDRFTDFAEAVSFIQRHLTQLTLDALAGGQAIQQVRVLKESFKMWERFTSIYTDMVFDAMARTVKQSQLVKDQIDQVTERAFKTWQLPAHADPRPIVQALQDLQAQVQALSEQVRKLEEALPSQPEARPAEDEKLH